MLWKLTPRSRPQRSLLLSEPTRTARNVRTNKAIQQAQLNKLQPLPHSGAANLFAGSTSPAISDCLSHSTLEIPSCSASASVTACVSSRST